jgi:hypothetical protein
MGTRCERRPRPQFDEILDREFIGPQEANQIAMAKVELHRRIIGPLEPMHAELRPQQSIGGCHSFLVWHAQHQQRAVAEEQEFTAGPEEAGRLGDPAVRIGPDGRSVLADDQVKAGGAQRNGSPAARTSGNLSPNSSWNCRAMSSWPGVGSTPTERAPRRTSHADTYAVPQPSSAARTPSTCTGRSWTSDSGIPNSPQRGSAADHCRRASESWSSRRASHASVLALK